MFQDSLGVRTQFLVSALNPIRHRRIVYIDYADELKL